MAKNRSDKSRYQSDYTDGFVTASQWVAEQLCVRKAAQEKRKLGPKFWRDPFWQKDFRRQVGAVKRLIDEHGEAAVVATLKRGDLLWCATADAKQFRTAVIEEKNKAKALEDMRLRVVASTTEEPNPIPTAVAKPPHNTFAGPKNKLLDLD